MDELRAELERGGSAGSMGTITGLINWLGTAANTARSAATPLQAAYQRLISGYMPRSSSASSLDASDDADLDPTAVAELQAVLLGSRGATVKLIRRCPQLLQMERQELIERLVCLKGHLLTVQQRLGMTEALMGRFDAAKERLHSVDAPLQEALGEGNPVSEELRFTLALVSLREMEADGVSDPARRQECLAAMEKHLKALSAYGDDHMLVKKAAELHAEASGAAPAAGGSG